MKIAVDSTYWNSFIDFETSGYTDYIILEDSASLPTGYIDVYTELITDIEKLGKFVDEVQKDYVFGYDLLVTAVETIGYNNLTEAGKTIACNSLAVRLGKSFDKNTIIGHFMAVDGLSLDEAVDKAIDMIDIHYDKCAKTFDNRFKIGRKYCMKYMVNDTDVADFARSVREYRHLLKEYGIVYKEWRDETEGIVDYIHSDTFTGKNYTYNGKTIEEIQADLKDIFIHRHKY